MTNGINQICQQLFWHFARVECEITPQFGDNRTEKSVGICIGTCGAARIFLTYVRDIESQDTLTWQAAYDSKPLSIAHVLSAGVKGFYFVFNFDDFKEIVRHQFTPLSNLKPAFGKQNLDFIVPFFSEEANYHPSARIISLKTIVDKNAAKGEYSDNHSKVTLVNYREIGYVADENTIKTLSTWEDPKETPIFNEEGEVYGFLNVAQKKLFRFDNDFYKRIIKEAAIIDKFKEIYNKVKQQEFVLDAEHFFVDALQDCLENGTYAMPHGAPKEMQDCVDFPNVFFKITQLSIAECNHNPIFNTFCEIVKYHQQHLPKENKDEIYKQEQERVICTLILCWLFVNNFKNIDGVKNNMSATRQPSSCIN